MNGETSSSVDEINVGTIFVVVKSGEILFEGCGRRSSEFGLNMKVLEGCESFVFFEQSSSLERAPGRHEFPDDAAMVASFRGATSSYEFLSQRRETRHSFFSFSEK